MYIYIYVYMYMYIYIYTYMYICIQFKQLSEPQTSAERVWWSEAR